MTHLDETPARKRALNMVADGRVMWRAAQPAGVEPRKSARFAQADGTRLSIPVHVAVCELHKAGLIVVDGGVVLLTAAGRARLSEWDATRAVR